MQGICGGSHNGRSTKIRSSQQKINSIKLQHKMEDGHREWDNSATLPVRIEFDASKYRFCLMPVAIFEQVEVLKSINGCSTFV